MTESSGAASAVAEALRADIITGRFAPGAQLPQERVREAHSVSRSTLREAFQLLIRERLLVHELARGVFVRQLSRDDISDLYVVRRAVECAALRQITTLMPARLRRLSATITDGHAAADKQDWNSVAAASIRFHEALVALAGSDRLDSITSGVLGEFRLAYAQMRDTQMFHAAFLKRNGEIADVLRCGNIEGAAQMLERYLHDAEAMLQAAYIG